MPKVAYTGLLVVLLAAVTPANSAELRDPTRPTFVGQAADNDGPVAAISVTAVFISGERRIAVVNGQRLRVGQSVGGAVVRAINPNNVTFERDGRSFSVSLRSGFDRK